MNEDRFVALPTIQRELVLTTDQALSLIMSGDLPAIRLFDTWRVERRALEHFIDRAYEDAARLVRANKTQGGSDRSREESSTVSWLAGATGGAVAPPVSLTPQMARVLRLVAQGLSNAEIARELSVEVSTVKSHVSRLLGRLGVRDRAQLIAYTWRLGILQRDS